MGLGNYLAIARDVEFWESLWRGVVYAASTTVLQLGLGVAAALVLHRSFHGRAAVRALVLFPYMIPTIVAVIVWRWLLNETYGLVDDTLLRWRLIREPIVWLGVDHIMSSLVAMSVWRASVGRYTICRGSNLEERRAFKVSSLGNCFLANIFSHSFLSLGSWWSFLFNSSHYRCYKSPFFITPF